MPNSADNPLLLDPYFPPFAAITPDNARVAVLAVLEQSRAAIETVVAGAVRQTPVQTLRQLEAIDDRLARIWSPVAHLNAVMNSDALRTVYEECLAELTRYSTDMGQHEGLFNVYRQIAEKDDFLDLNPAQQQSVQHALRDFTLAGIALPTSQQQRFKQIKQRMSELSSQFSNHVLDATQAWHLHLSAETELAGLPETARAQARNAARNKALDGWVITLDYPSYLAAMTYADNRALREQVYRAYCTRASDLGAAEHDNSAIIVELLSLRRELAELLGYENFSELSLAKKMADRPETVLTFLRDLAEESRPKAQQEWVELQHFAERELGLKTLEPWDVAYVSEKLKAHNFDLSQEQLKPYFPADKVIDGMFQVATKLFGIEFEKCSGIEVWHPQVDVFALKKGGVICAYFYLDLFARAHKRGGAWMDSCRSRRATETGMQLPVAYLTCNFTPPLAETPSLLSFDEVTTLFHEFGHGLHHMLTEIDVAAVSGINGVPWDAVELPSQFLENWCWAPEVIPLISEHYQTREILPVALLQKMLAARHFQCGMFMVRQLEFALFDFELHLRRDIQTVEHVQNVLNQIRAQVAVLKAPEFNRFQHSFSHIFAGGYAAGYYSYKWAEVLSADAFSRFEEKGLFDSESGTSFVQEILAKGGSGDALSFFKAFRGRDPSVEPLLRHTGIRG